MATWQASLVFLGKFTVVAIVGGFLILFFFSRHHSCKLNAWYFGELITVKDSGEEILCPWKRFSCGKSGSHGTTPNDGFLCGTCDAALGLRYLPAAPQGNLTTRLLEDSLSGLAF